MNRIKVKAPVSFPERSDKVYNGFTLMRDHIVSDSLAAARPLYPTVQRLAILFRRANPLRPSRPMAIRLRVAGSGTGAVVTAATPSTS